MTISLSQLGLYSTALFILFMTPGPVWLGVIARGLSAGFRGVWPLALGVALGDILWPVLAIYGLSWVLSIYGGFLETLRWVACGTFLVMGLIVLRHARMPITQNAGLTRPGIWAGFFAGIALILANPKAILFYMGMLPGFFDVSALTTRDIIAIAIMSFVVPMVGNLALGAFIERVRRIVQGPNALYRMNVTSGCLLILVGLIIPFT